jgi:hypothetical protein
MLSLKTPLPADAQLPVFNEFFFWVCICAARPTCWRFLPRFGRCPVYMMMMNEARADPPRQRLKSTFFTDDSHSIILSHDNALIFQRKFFPRTMKNRLSEKNTVGWSRDPRGCLGAEAMLRV